MKIPLLFTDVQSPSMPLRNYGGADLGLGIAEGAQGLIAQITQDQAQFNEKTKRQADTLAISNILIETEKENLKTTEELKKNPDIIKNPAAYFPAWMKQWEDSAKAKIAQIADPELKEKAQLALQRQQAEHMPGQADYGRRLQISSGLAQTMKNSAEWIELGRPDLAEKEWEKAIDNDFLSPSAGQHQILVVKEQAKRKETLDNIKLARGQIDLVKGDPEKVDSILDRYKIDEENRVALEERAASLWEKQKREEKENQINNIYSSLKDTFKDDYAWMLKAIRNPTFQKDNGITDTKVVNAVEDRLRSEWNLVQEEKKITHEANAAKLFVNIGKTPTAKINEMVKADQISWQQGEHFKNEILNPPDAKTDPRAYLSLLRRINEGTEDKSRVETEILRSGNLSREDKKSLGLRLYREEDKENDVWIKKGEKYLEDMIIPKRGMEAQFRTTFKEEKDNYEALQTFHTAIDNARKTGKGLTGQEIFEKAKEIAPAYMKSLPERMTEYAEEMKKVGVEMKGRTEVLKKAEKFKTKEDVIAAYRAGKITYAEAENILMVKFSVK